EEENPTPAPENPSTTPAQVKPAQPATAPGMAKPRAGVAEAKKPQAGAAVEQGYLEGRAEAESPNEEIDTVQNKNYKAANRFELTLYPGAIQLNSKFTNADGIALAVDYALQENFALQI